MNDKAEFAIETLKEYAKQNQVLPRSTSDLSKLEEWLIIELLSVKNLNIHPVGNSSTTERLDNMGVEIERLKEFTGLDQL